MPGTTGDSQPCGSAGYARLLGNEEGEFQTARVPVDAIGGLPVPVGGGRPEMALAL